MADAVREKEAFFVPGVPVHPYLVLLRQSERLDESQGQYEFVPQCGLFPFKSSRSRFFYETYLSWAYQPLVFLGLLPTGDSSRLTPCLAL